MTDAYVCFAGGCRRSPKPSRHPGENRDLRLQCVLSKVSRAARDPGFHRDDGGVAAGFSSKPPLFEFVYRAVDIISRKDAASHSSHLLLFRIHQLAQGGVDLGLVAARAALFCLEPVKSAEMCRNDLHNILSPRAGCYLTFIYKHLLPMKRGYDFCLVKTM
jgi:hypothetical protein